jgi:hypothetical protein
LQGVDPTGYGWQCAQVKSALSCTTGVSMAATNEVERRCSVTQTLASWRLEGFEPDAQYLALLDRYVAGELSLTDLGNLTNAAFGLPTTTAG